MRGLSLVGLLAGLGLVGLLIFNQLKPSPETGDALPTEAIDKANEAADTMRQETEKLQQDLQTLPDAPE